LTDGENIVDESPCYLEGGRDSMAGGTRYADEVKPKTRRCVMTLKGAFEYLEQHYADSLGQEVIRLDITVGTREGKKIIYSKSEFRAKDFNDKEVSHER
jgi:hypothetical protein